MNENEKDTLTLGDRTFTISPLGLGQMRQLNEVLKRMRTGKPEDAFSNLVDASTYIHLSIKRAHPELSLEDFLDNVITAKNFQQALDAVVRVSAPAPVAVAEPKSGETQPSAPAASV